MKSAFKSLQSHLIQYDENGSRQTFPLFQQMPSSSRHPGNTTHELSGSSSTVAQTRPYHLTSQSPLRLSFLPPLPQILLNSPYHLIPHLSSLLKPWSKIPLNLLKLLPISIHISQIHPLTPISSRECEFQIIGAEGFILNRGLDALVEDGWGAVDVFCYAEPEAEELCKVSG